MSDKEIDAVVDDIKAQMTTGAPNKPETPETTPEPFEPADFSDDDRKTGDDDNFDPDNVPVDQKKTWPKKFTNALSRRDKDRAKLRAENEANAKRIAELQEQLNRSSQTQTQPTAAPEQTGAFSYRLPDGTEYSKDDRTKIDAVLAKKPDINKYKMYGDYMEALTDWKADVRDVQRDIAFEAREEALKTAQQSERNNQRIATQAQNFIKEHPEYLSLVEANADILESYPKHVKDALTSTERPELAFAVLANTQGALEALGRMNPTQAAIYIGRAEQIGIAQFAGQTADAHAQQRTQPQNISSAPKPMGLPKTAARGGKSLESMNADEILKHLGIS